MAKVFGKKVLAGVLLGCVVVLSGCAKSPQQIAIQPNITAVDVLAGQGERIQVQANDNRPSQELGSRGGTYAKTSVISTKGDVEKALADQIAAKLLASGYQVVTENSDILWQVKLEKLTYQFKKIGNVKKEVALETEFSAEIKQGNRTFRNRYRANRQWEVVNQPSDARNEEMVNLVISDGLGAMLKDPAIVEFLGQVN